MNWFSIGLAAGAGVLAALLARLFANPKENKNGYGIAFGILFAGLYALSRFVVQPALEVRRAESELQKIPAYQALKEHDPETYDQLMAEVKKAVEGNRNKTELASIFRAKIEDVIKERLPSASDEAVFEYISVTMDELDEIYEGGGDLCHQFLFPQPGRFLDVRDHVSKELLAADLAALAKVIETSAKDPQEPPTEAEVMPQLQPVFLSLAGKYGDELSLMQNPTAPGVDKRRVCELTSDLYDEILAMSPSDGGRVLRFMLSQ